MRSLKHGTLTIHSLPRLTQFPTHPFTRCPITAMSISDLPHLNAALNALSAVLLVIAWFHIKARRIEAHRTHDAAGIRVVGAVPDVVRHLPREHRIEAVSRDGCAADDLLRDPDPARDSRGGGAAAGAGDPQARAAPRRPPA